MLKITRIIPERKESISFDWIKPNFMLYKTFRESRERMGLSVVSRCYWCRTWFTDDDMMALGCIHGKGNKFFCQSCAAPACNASSPALSVGKPDQGN